MAFVKLSSRLLDSSLWLYDHDVLRVFIFLLLKADAQGVCSVTIPAIAHQCMVPIQRVREILDVLASPDEDSRTAEHDGRRILVERGPEMRIIILNYKKYREMDYTAAERQRRRRQALKGASRRDTVTSRRDIVTVTQAEAEAEAEAEADTEDYRPDGETDTCGATSDDVAPPAPADDAALFSEEGKTLNTRKTLPAPDEVVGLYNRILGGVLPTVMKLTEQRRRRIKARTKDLLPTLEHWRTFFEAVKASPFLLGENPRRWRCTFDWLLSEGATARVLEGAYRSRREVPPPPPPAEAPKSKAVPCPVCKQTLTLGGPCRRCAEKGEANAVQVR